MKTHRIRCTAIALAIGLVLILAPVYSAEPVRAQVDLTNAKLEQIETNLIMALESNYPSLEASAAQVIRDLKVRVPEYNFSRSIIPLMRTLKDENMDARVRQVAALALHDIDTERGDYAIEREARFSDQQQLRHLCWFLVNERVRERLALKNGEQAGPGNLTAAR